MSRKRKLKKHGKFKIFPLIGFILCLLLYFIQEHTDIVNTMWGHSEIISSSEQESTEQASSSIEKEVTAEGEMKVTFIDIGQGDATLIQTEEQCMLIDTGSSSEKEALLTVLDSCQVTYIDFLVLTHPDEDHIGNGNTIMETYSVGAVLYPEVESDTKAWSITLNAINNSDAVVEHPMEGDIYYIGDAVAEIITPNTITDTTTKNNASIGMKLTHGSKSFILCGDAEEEAENKMVSANIYLEADVLKCSHHGSATATTQAFLDRINPVYAIISCGANNKYGHPHAEVLARLEDDDVQIYRTDLQGSITAISDGNNIRISSESNKEEN